eukprot:m51a1_g6028 hypothetical protein (282) ;mRNA; f:108237-109437
MVGPLLSTVRSGKAAAWGVRGGCLLAVCTLLTTLAMCKSQGHVPPRMWLPQISLTGNTAPERYVYAVGLTTCAAALFMGGLHMHLRVLRPLLSGASAAWRRTNIIGAILICTGSVFMATQALVPLPLGASEAMVPSAPGVASSSSRAPFELGTGGLVHVTAAGLFFLLALAHTLLLCVAYRKCEQLRAASLAGRWWRMRCCALGFVVAVGVASTAGRLAFGGVSPDNASEYAVAALAQWSLVATLLAVFASYSAEFDIVAAVHESPACEYHTLEPPTPKSE